MEGTERAEEGRGRGELLSRVPRPASYTLLSSWLWASSFSIYKMEVVPMAPLTLVFQLSYSLLLSGPPLGREGSCPSQKPLSTTHSPTPSMRRSSWLDIWLDIWGATRGPELGKEPGKAGWGGIWKFFKP